MPLQTAQMLMLPKTSSALHQRIMSACVGCVILLTPAFAYSNSEEDAFVMNREGKRFFALAPARSGMPSQALRSDAQAMRQGFLRLDRSLSVSPRTVNVAKPTAKTNVEVKTTNTASGNDAKVLTLFDTEGQMRSGSAEAVFLGTGRTVGRINHIWPVAQSAHQYMSSGFGMRNDPFTGRRAFHGGMDIAAPIGTSVLASADGVVSDLGRKGGYGNFVLLNHADGTQTMYNHLHSASARVGARVRAGQVIGAVGSTGRSTGPHLDYRLIAGGKKQDPMTILAGKKPSYVGTMASANTNRGGRISASMALPSAQPAVRVQSGVRIITPRERLAQAGGFIRVR